MPVIRLHTRKQARSIGKMAQSLGSYSTLLPGSALRGLFIHTSIDDPEMDRAVFFVDDSVLKQAFGVDSNHRPALIEAVEYEEGTLMALAAAHLFDEEGNFHTVKKPDGTLSELYDISYLVAGTYEKKRTTH